MLHWLESQKDASPFFLIVEEKGFEFFLKECCKSVETLLTFGFEGLFGNIMVQGVGSIISRDVVSWEGGKNGVIGFSIHDLDNITEKKRFISLSYFETL